MFTTYERVEHKCRSCKGDGSTTLYSRKFHCFSCDGQGKWYEYVEVKRPDEEYIQWCLSDMFK